MGGGYGMQENNGNSDNFVLYSVIGILGITSLGLFFFRHRKIKNNQM